MSNVRAPGARSALAKFRAGVAPIMIELGQYTNLPVEARKCPFCPGVEVEKEFHVIILCPSYDETRKQLFLHASYCHTEITVLV